MVIGFLNLPQELRDMVYEYALVHRDPICLQPQPSECPDLALLRSNKTINREATPIFYAGNCFKVPEHSPWETQWVMEQLGASNLGHMQDLSFRCPLRPAEFTQMQLMLEDMDNLTVVAGICPNVTRLRLRMDDAAWLNPSSQQRADGGYLKNLADALQNVETRLEGFANLKQVVIELDTYPKQVSAEIEEVLTAVGWTVKLSGTDKQDAGS